MKEHNPFQERLRFGSQLGLARITQLCKELGNPQDQFKSIHIGGTNGKGSVSAILNSILQHSGYKVGLFTSPHLVDYRERFQINGELISLLELQEIVKRVNVAIDKVEQNYASLGSVTEFEAATVVGFLYFADNQVDCAIIEVGLGGRLDSTNVLAPEISVITSISYDHTERLGNLLTEIAIEKAGIIKQGIPVVSGYQNEEVIKILSQSAADLNSAFYCLDTEDWSPLCTDSKGGQLLFSYFSKDTLSISLLGYHQLENAATALLTLKVLKELGWDFSETNIKKGLANIYWPGRLEIVSDNEPFIIIDGAHNQAGISNLAKNLPRIIGQDKLTFIIGLTQDRPANLLHPLLPLAQRIIFTKAKGGRIPAKEPQELYDYAVSKNVYAEVQETIYEALEAISKEEKVCICGSLYLIGEVKAYFSQKNKGKSLQMV